MRVQVMLCFENKMSEAASVLADMLKSIEQLETRNSNLCLQGNPGKENDNLWKQMCMRLLQ